MTDATPKERPNPVIVATLKISEQFNNAIGGTLGGLVEKMKSEPIWADSVLRGAIKLEIGAQIDTDSQRLIAHLIIEACKAYGTCRRCNGTMAYNGGACDWCMIPKAEEFTNAGSEPGGPESPEDSQEDPKAAS